jgi:predicted flap endonuclease-1-like 5' DNA nuclease
MLAEWTRKAHAAQLRCDELVEFKSQVEQNRAQMIDLSAQLQSETAKAAQVEALQAQITKQDARLAELRVQLTEARKKTAPLTLAQKRVEKSRTVIADMKKEARLYQQQLDSLYSQAEKREGVIADLTAKIKLLEQGKGEDLETIKGIGPKYAERLREAGIGSLNDLANATVQRLEEIIAPPKWQQPAFTYWIDQAQRLSQEQKPKKKPSMPDGQLASASLETD